MAVGARHTRMRTAARHLTRPCLATFLLAPITQVLAQPPRPTSVGYVSDVRGDGGGRDSSCARLAPVRTARGVLTIFRSSGPLLGWPRDGVVLGDTLRVQSQTDVYVHIDSGAFGTGNFILAPQLGRCPEVAAALRISGISLSDGRSGSYAVSSRRDRTAQGTIERLILEVEYGGAYVQWARGPLSIIALGREIPITGTDLAVIVDPDANVAVVYLREGIIQLAGASVAQPGVFRMGRTGAAQRINVGQQFVDNMSFHASDMWKLPVREAGADLGRGPGLTSVDPPKRGFPWKWIGIGALTVGAGYLAYDLWIRKDPNPSQPPSRRGTVIVSIPL